MAAFWGAFFMVLFGDAKAKTWYWWFCCDLLIPQMPLHFDLERASTGTEKKKATYAWELTK